MADEATLTATIARIGPPDDHARAGTKAEFDAKAKPRGSLGRLEEIAIQIAGVRGGPPRQMQAVVVVAAGDHGVAAEGVSAYPREVTAQMVGNFASGGAAINVLSRTAGARLIVVDAGVAAPVDHALVRSVGGAAGTANIVAGPAMTREQSVTLLLAGVDLATELASEEIDLVALGEMGIANTTAASALTAALLDVDPAGVCGRGTGLDDAGLARKVEAVRRALEVNPVEHDDPLAVLATLGGFEIAFLTGLALGCAANRLPVLLDGFITAAAALVATKLAPLSVHAMIASHLSPEPGHACVLRALDLGPLLNLRLRLGEGSGAALALPLIRSSIALLNEMATFGDARVTDAGR